MKTLQLQTTGGLDVSLIPDAITARDSAIEAANAIEVVADELDQHDCAEALKALRYIEKTAEEGRSAVKAPVLAIERKIDGLAKEFVGPVVVASKRLQGLLSKFQEEQNRKAREAEEARQRALAEEKRKAEEAEKARKAAEEAAAKAAEEARKAEEAEFLAPTPDEAAKAQADTNAAQQKAAEEAAKAEEAKKAAAAAEADRLKAMVSTKKITAPRVEGMTVREVWKFEVLNIAQVYLARPDLVRLEPNVAAINSAIKGGLDVPGLKVWKETSATVRV